MKTLYLDVFSGISGDMFVGALVDLGADPRKLERELKKLKLDGYHLHVSRQHKSSIQGVKFDVHVAGGHAHGPEQNHMSHASHPTPHRQQHDHSRNFAEIKRLISRSRLSNWVKKKSAAVFRRIAEAEGKIHGLPPGEVHFHEVGAVDSIIDIVGACVAMEMLGKPRVLASPVVEGTGWIDCAHGRFPVPAPATLAILGARGIGVTQCDEPHELVTPTGAALLAEFAERIEPMKNLVGEKIGVGIGSRENKTRPNVLRVVLRESEGRVASGGRRLRQENYRRPSPVARHPLDWEIDRLAVLETNLDDHNPEILGQFMETALAAGALDVFYTPIQMKKNRSGVMLTVLCGETEADKFSEMILRETTAFGVRRTVAERRKLRREFAEVRTPFGKITVKLGKINGTTIHATPEFESCKKQAARAKIPIKMVYEAANRAILAS
jgi:uncharacterized protein (TIGR00299 family) protein